MGRANFLCQHWVLQHTFCNPVQVPLLKWRTCHIISVIASDSVHGPYFCYPLLSLAYSTLLSEFAFNISGTTHMSSSPAAMVILVSRWLWQWFVQLTRGKNSDVQQYIWSSGRAAYVFLLLTVFFHLHLISNLNSYAEPHCYLWRKVFIQSRLESNSICS